MKNKEVEELLKEIKFFDGAYVLEGNNRDLLLSYIEQLKINYKEANESITWWQNRYNAIVKQNDDNHKNVVKLENNRDKAITLLEENVVWGEDMNSQKAIDILKGGSDD